jgi:hypothetical protein
MDFLNGISAATPESGAALLFTEQRAGASNAAFANSVAEVVEVKAKLVGNQLEVVIAADIGIGDCLVILTESGVVDTLEEILKKPLNVFEVSRSFRALPNGGGGYELPLKPMVVLAGARSAEDGGGISIPDDANRTIVFTGPQKVLRIRPGEFRDALVKSSEAGKKKESEDGVVGISKGAEIKNQMWVTEDRDGGMFTSPDRTNLPQRMKNITGLKRLLSKPGMLEFLADDGTILSSRLEELRSVASSPQVSGTATLLNAQFPNLHRWRVVESCAVMDCLGELAQGKWRAWNSSCVDGLSLAAFTVENLHDLPADDSTFDGRAKIGRSLWGLANVMEGLTDLPFTSSALGRLSNSIGTDEKWEKLEDFRTLYAFEDTIARWFMMTWGQTRAQINLVLAGKTIPEGWLPLLEYLLLEIDPDTIEGRPHWNFKKSAAYRNLKMKEVGARKRRPAAAAPSDSDGGLEEIESQGARMKRLKVELKNKSLLKKRNRKEKQKEKDTEDANPSVEKDPSQHRSTIPCLLTVAHMFKVKESNGEVYTCPYGDKCRFSHEVARISKTNEQWSQVVERSATKNTALKADLMKALTSTKP